MPRASMYIVNPPELLGGHRHRRLIVEDHHGAARVRHGDMVFREGGAHAALHRAAHGDPAHQLDALRTGLFDNLLRRQSGPG